MKRWLAVVPLVLVAACSGSSAPDRAVESAPPPTPVLDSPSAAPSTAASPSAQAPRVAAPGDVDGDGAADGISVSATAVTVALTSGGTVSAPIVDSDLPSPAVSGLHDLDRDGRNEVWLETARGATTSFVQAYRYDGTALRELTFEGGHIRFGIGGAVTHGDGFTCTDKGELRVMTAESDDGTTYRVRTVTYRVAGAVLERVLEVTGTATSSDDPRVRGAYQVDCGSVGESD